MVSSQSARSQPRLFSSYSTCRRNVIQSVTLAGLKMTAARFSGTTGGSSGTARLRTISPTSSWGIGTLTPADEQGDRCSEGADTRRHPRCR